jgi:hypothetical protein
LASGDALGKVGRPIAVLEARASITSGSALILDGERDGRRPQWASRSSLRRSPSSSQITSSNKLSAALANASARAMNVAPRMHAHVMVSEAR